MSDKFAELANELDRESYSWLVDNHAGIATAIEAAVQRGATPEAVRRLVIERCGYNRIELARRCENAARFLDSVKS